MEIDLRVTCRVPNRANYLRKDIPTILKRMQNKFTPLLTFSDSMQVIHNIVAYLRDDRFHRTLRTWIASFVMLVIFCVLELMLFPVVRQFNPQDPRISHPYTEETVSSFACLVLVIVVPLMVVGVLERTDLHRVNTIGLSFVFSMSINLLVIEVLKNIIGKPRPDFMSRCGPVASVAITDVSACFLPPYGQWSLIDGLRSFPSGHLAASFGGLGFLSLYLRHLAKPGKKNSLPSLCLQVVPVVVAALIAFSRTRDFRHDIYDVTVGAALGTGVGIWGWKHVDVESLLKPVLPV